MKRKLFDFGVIILVVTLAALLSLGQMIFKAEIDDFLRDE